MAETLQKVAQATGLAADDSPTYTFPDFDAMPPVDGMPQGCAWGFFDKDGKKDEIGSMRPPSPYSPISPSLSIEHDG
jgi:hypothetical protein